jgi:hypothetical protein
MQCLKAISGSNDRPGRTAETCQSVYDLDLPSLGKAAQSGDEPGDDRILVRAHRVDFDRGRSERHAARAGPRHFADESGLVQIGFRRNAAHVEAHSAQGRALFSNDHLQSQIGCVKRGGIAARAAAHDKEVTIHLGHLLLATWSG